MVLNQDGRRLVNVNIALMVLSIAFVALRLAARFKKQRPLIPSDFAVILALVVALGYYAVSIAAPYQVGGTIEYAELTPDNVSYALKFVFALEVLLSVTITLSKISLLLLFRSIFVDRRFHVAIYVVMSVALAWLLGVLFLLIFQCPRVPEIWSVEAQALQKCVTGASLVLGYEMANIFVDILIFVLPIHQIWKLQMKLKRKLATLLVFLTGIFVVVTSIVRSIVIFAPVAEGRSLSITTILCWTSAQVGACIICACLPTIPPLIPDSISDSFRPLASWVTSRFGSRRSVNRSTSPARQSSSSSNRVQLPLAKLKGYSSAEAQGSSSANENTENSHIIVRRDVDIEQGP